MKKIPLADAFKMLQNCSCVVYEDNLIYPSLEEPTGTDENQFLFLGWYDPNDGEDHCAKFDEENNREVTVSGSSMFLIDLDGDEMQLTLLASMTLE